MLHRRLHLATEFVCARAEGAVGKVHVDAQLLEPSGIRTKMYRVDRGGRRGGSER